MMEFTFEESAWEQALGQLEPGSSLSGLTVLSLTQDMDEEELEEALLELEQRRITLEVGQLPQSVQTGEAARRLRQEQQLAGGGNLLTGLEETDPLRLYLEELASIPVAGDLTLFARSYLDGDQSAAQRLADLSLSRCVELAQEYTGHGVLLLDLIQEASLGLWQGILHYTEGSFEAHRDWWIRQYLAKTVLLQARAGDIGQKLRQGMEDYRDVDQKLLSELGRNPTLEEIAEAMHVSAGDAAVYADMVSAAQNRRRLDEARQEKQPEEDDEQAVENTAYFRSRQRILEMLSVLTEQESMLVSLRFGLEGGVPLTPEQTGAKMGLTAQEVVQMEAAALAKLRNE